MSSGDPKASETDSQSTPANASENPSAESVTPSTPTDKGPEQAPAQSTGDSATGDSATGDSAAGESAAGESAASETTPSPDAAATESPSGGSAPDQSAESTPRPAPGSSLARGAGPLAARGLGVAKPSSPAAPPRGAQNKPSGPGKPASQGKPAGQGKSSGQGRGGASGRPMGPALGPFRPHGTPPAVQPEKTTAPDARALEDQELAAEEARAAAPSTPAGHRPRVAVPSIRQPLSDDLQAELEAQLASADVDAILGHSSGLENRRGELEEGQRIQGRVLKIDTDSVFVALGGPDEGSVAREQFETEPEVGQSIEVVVRGFNREDGLYNLTLPGQAMDVSDWEDIDEGSIVEAVATAANTGGLEVTVGSIRGFIPISQIAPFRVEDASEFVGQRLMCVVTECNPRRRNLVLSRRAVIEREREEQRKEQLEKMEPGDIFEGTVRSVKDFGAFVDLGGLDGLIHVTKLSWDHVKHPSDVLEVGQKVKVKVEKVDKQTGKISLSYRDMLENPWDTVESSLAVGTVTTGEVTRLANFGAFVRLAPGIEGLVHISEIAGHRVSNVNSVLKEGETVSVKVLAIERESQKISLSIKQAQSKAADTEATKPEEVDEPPREPAVKRQHTGPLRGGVGQDSGGSQFGLKW